MSFRTWLTIFICSVLILLAARIAASQSGVVVLPAGVSWLECDTPATPAITGVEAVCPTRTPTPLPPPTETPDPSGPAQTIIIDRGLLPYETPYDAITLVFDIGNSATFDATGADSTHRNDDLLHVTTSAASVTVSWSDPNGAGYISKRPLPAGKHMAWSHGIDDGYYSAAIGDHFTANNAALIWYAMPDADSHWTAPAGVAGLDAAECGHEIEQGNSCGLHTKALLSPSEYHDQWNSMMQYASYYPVGWTVTAAAAPLNNGAEGADILTARDNYNNDLVFVEGNGGGTGCRGDYKALLAPAGHEIQHAYYDPVGDRTRYIRESSLCLDKPLKRANIPANQNGWETQAAHFDHMASMTSETNLYWYQTYNHGDQHGLYSLAAHIWSNSTTWTTSPDRVIAHWLHYEYAGVTIQ